MTSTLTVIGLVTRMRKSTSTAYGEAVYREKILNQRHTFTFKQFVNARNEYNEAFGEGDLILFGGKFTVDEEKLMVNFINFFLYNINLVNNIIFFV